MKKALLSLTLVASALFFNSCASIFSGTRQTITVETDPPGAEVQINGLSQGTTPATIRMRKSLNPSTVLLTKEGYNTGVFIPTNAFDMIGLLNLFFWPGFIVDAVNGSMMRYDQTHYKIKMSPAVKAQKDDKTKE